MVKKIMCVLKIDLKFSQVENFKLFSYDLQNKYQVSSIGL